MKVSINIASPLEKLKRIDRGVVLLTGDVNIADGIKGEPMLTVNCNELREVAA